VCVQLRLTPKTSKKGGLKPILQLLHIKYLHIVTYLLPETATTVQLDRNILTYKIKAMIFGGKYRARARKIIENKIAENFRS
jgi:hypothetical protein